MNMEYLWKNKEWENRVSEREILYCIGGGWMNECGALVKIY
jgi:hypothetical protein